MMQAPRNPVVILPGVLFWDQLYTGMKKALSAYLPESMIEIVPITIVDWTGFPPSPERSTNRVMAALDRTLAVMQKRFPDEKITIVAHSGGGTVALVYLLEQEFQGDVYHRGSSVGRLVALGTPFETIEHFAKIKTDFINTHLTPGFFNRCSVVSIVSDKYTGALDKGIVERMCYMFYKNVSGRGNIAGDGIVPVKSCFLKGAENVTISGVEHLPTPHTRWYGTQEGIEQWIGWM
ncbi:MAG: alpha/beta hydrolase [Chlorobium phaeobacteroides]|uniref:AB hydrolase-1 domain-containing protein n=1 Tax=Chlorobium phaeobacteroides (strain BS1) TaxID=331678 RepID=B3EJ08_CHLPB|nr:alpha/beta hydrolase [Chlorobium phaeobacteroides]MBL6956454.1 alpha/beta hydrolase [Chlorobium phaeobacteroides]